MRYDRVGSRASNGNWDTGIGAKGRSLANFWTAADKEGGGQTSDVDEELRTLQPEFWFKTRQLHVPSV